jgi:hypothetical protein
MIDKIKLMAENFNPEFIKENFRWREIEIDDEEFKELDIKSNKYLQTNITKKSRMFSLRMLLSENLKTGNYSLSINGSIRKWYFNKNSRKDLNYYEFVDCIEILSNKLGLKKDEIWRLFKVTQLEIGVTLLLKSFNNDILDCFVKYRNAKRGDKNVTTIYFEFINYDLVIYDKYLEILGKKELTDLDKNIISKYLMLRFEIDINKVSIPNFKMKYHKLTSLKSNWNNLPNELYKYLNAIKFVDTISKKEVINKNNRPKISNNIFLRWVVYSHMKTNGIHKTIIDFNEMVLPNNKSKYFVDLMNIYKSNIISEKDYKAIILYELKKKTDRLYNKGNIKYINT